MGIIHYFVEFYNILIYFFIQIFEKSGLSGILKKIKRGILKNPAGKFDSQPG